MMSRTPMATQVSITARDRRRVTSSRSGVCGPMPLQKASMARGLTKRARLRRLHALEAFREAARKRLRQARGGGGIHDDQPVTQREGALRGGGAAANQQQAGQEAEDEVTQGGLRSGWGDGQCGRNLGHQGAQQRLLHRLLDARRAPRLVQPAGKKGLQRGRERRGIGDGGSKVPAAQLLRHAAIACSWSLGGGGDAKPMDDAAPRMRRGSGRAHPHRAARGR